MIPNWTDLSSNVYHSNEIDYQIFSYPPYFIDFAGDGVVWRHIDSSRLCKEAPLGGEVARRRNCAGITSAFLSLLARDPDSYPRRFSSVSCGAGRLWSVPPILIVRVYESNRLPFIFDAPVPPKLPLPLSRAGRTASGFSVVN